MTIKGPNMRVILGGLAVLALAGCGQSGGSEKSESGGGGGQSANIAEGTITDAMIDLSASEGYGATSTVDESAPVAEPAKDGDTDKAAAKPKAEPRTEPKPKVEEAKAETPAPSEPADAAEE